MSRPLHLVSALAWAALCASPLAAQSVISAHSGVVQYIEGAVSINGDAIQPKFAQFPDVKTDQVLATQEGRAEVLLTPGVFLRLPENSSVRMISNSLADTRLAVVYGSAMVEVGQLLPGNSITIQMHDATVALPKRGLYRFDADTDLVRVYSGEARAMAGSSEIGIGKGHQATLTDPKLEAQSFDSKSTDAFYNWSSRRAEYVADANVTSARVASDSGYGSSVSPGFLGLFGSGGGSYNSAYGSVYGNPGGWNWNPWFGMFTFVPATGIYWSPFGVPYYSPAVITQIYVPARTGFGPAGLGSVTGARSIGATPLGTSTGMSGGGGGFHPAAFGSGGHSSASGMHGGGAAPHGR